MQRNEKRIDLPAYPNGWFAVAYSEALSPGDVIGRKYFGQELVIWRGEAGEVGVADAYCPHLGAHLAHGGRVEGKHLVCPFHGWRFGSDGGCASMPYGSRIPQRARLGTLPVREQDGIILAFHDAGGREPEWEMPRFELGEWTPARSCVRTFRGHPQEVAENSADAAHFEFIHKTEAVRVGRAADTEGPIFRILFEAESGAPGSLHYEVSVHGPGLALGVMDSAGIRVFSRIYTTPIDGERVEMHMMSHVGPLASPTDTDALADAVAQQVFQQVDDDIVIWENKRYRPEPALNDAEAAIATFRRWYRGFYASSRAAEKGVAA